MIFRSSLVEAQKPYLVPFASCRVPCESRKWKCSGDFGCFLANSGRSCGLGAILSFEKPYIEWLVINVTAIRSPARAEKEET